MDKLRCIPELFTSTTPNTLRVSRGFFAVLHGFVADRRAVRSAKPTPAFSHPSQGGPRSGGRFRWTYPSAWIHPFSDKKSLFYTDSVEGRVLCVNDKMATTSVDAARLRLRGFSGKWLEERPGLQNTEFTGNWYYLGQILAHLSDRSFCQFLKFLGHMPQWDTQDRERDNHRREGPENLT